MAKAQTAQLVRHPLRVREAHQARGHARVAGYVVRGLHSTCPASSSARIGPTPSFFRKIAYYCPWLPTKEDERHRPRHEPRVGSGS